MHFCAIKEPNVNILLIVQSIENSIDGLHGDRLKDIVLNDSHTDPKFPYVFILADQCDEELTVVTPRSKGDSVKNYYINIPLEAGEPDDATLWKAWKLVFGFSSISIGFSV